MVLRRHPRILLLLALTAFGPKCAPDEAPDEALADPCIPEADVAASFTIDTGGWPGSDGDLDIDASCTVLGPLALSCSDDQAAMHEIHIELTAKPALPSPLKVGDPVGFRYKRTGWGGATWRGAWTVRDAGGELLLAANTASASHPSQPDFFAPVLFEVDMDTCAAEPENSCYSVQSVLLELADAGRTLRIGGGHVVDLSTGHRLQVERAKRILSGDPKFCSSDTPVYEFLIARID